MRETVEYAVGIFHGSIMAIQSGGEGGETCRFDVEANASGRGLSGREPRRNGDVLSNAFSIHPDGILRRCFLSVSGQPNGKRCVTESWWNGIERQERKRTRPWRCKRDWRVCRTTGVAHFGRENKVKGDEKGLLRNL